MGGDVSDPHPLDFLAGSLRPNKNIWSRDEAIKVVDIEIFNESMAEEMNNTFKNEVYILVKRLNMPPEKSILRSV